jgi:hypothetical protein
MECLDDVFPVAYPCWLLVHESSLTYTQEEGPALAEQILFVTVPGRPGQRSLPVFTDRELARRFADGADGLDEAVLVEVDSRAALLDFLNLVVGDGVADRVVLDPPQAVGPSRRAWAIDAVIRQLTTGEGRR